MAKGKVLVIGSNATRIELQGGGWAPTGQYLNETVVPAMALIEAGYEVVLATPDGTKPHIDELSDSAGHFGGDETALLEARAFWAQSAEMNEVRSLRDVIDEGLDPYAGLFFPGGHAPAVDLMQDAEVGTILRHFHERAKPTRSSAMARSRSPRRCRMLASFAPRWSPATPKRRPNGRGAGNMPATG